MATMPRSTMLGPAPEVDEFHHYSNEPDTYKLVRKAEEIEAAVEMKDVATDAKKPSAERSKETANDRESSDVRTARKIRSLTYAELKTQSEEETVVSERFAPSQGSTPKENQTKTNSDHVLTPHANSAENFSSELAASAEKASKEASLKEEATVKSEKQLLETVAEIFFSAGGRDNLAGLWAYGHTKISPLLGRVKPRPTLTMFLNDTDHGMQYTYSAVLQDNKSVVDAVNKISVKRSWNCRVFMSGVKKVSELDKFAYSPDIFNWTVVVSLQGANLSSIITTEGIHVNVALDSDETKVKKNAETIINTIKRYFY